MALLKFDMSSKSNQFPVIDAIHKAFRLNVKYPSELVKAKLTAIFSELGIELKVTAKFIEKYFIVKSDSFAHVEDQTIRCYIPIAYRFNNVAIKPD